MAHNRNVPAALITLLVLAGISAGCSSPTSPRPVGDVEISLGVSGGIAYREFSYRIAGSSGDIVGEECMSFCDWESGDTLARVSKVEVRALAQRFINDGFLDVPEEDYGEECCDQLHYVLTYRDERANKTVRGSSAAVPDAVNSLALAVMNFVDEARGLPAPD